MGERDAFGREKDEDTLAAMGWRASPDPPPPAEPATSAFSAGEASAPFAKPKPRPVEPPTAVLPAPETAPPPPPKPQPARPTFTRAPRRRGPSLARLLILVAIVAAGWIGVNKAVDAGRHGISDLRGKLNGIATPEPVAPSAAQSLLRPAPLRAALAKLPAGKLVSLRVAADRIVAQVLSGPTLHVAQVRADGSTADVKVPSGGSGEHARITVDAAAPQRIARTAARRAGRSVNSVDYLVRSGDGWELFFKTDGLHFHASASGRKVAKVG